MGVRRLSSFFLSHKNILPSPSNYYHAQTRFLVKVRLKWVKNRTLDHVIDIETDLKAASLLKDAIARSSHSFLSSQSLSRSHSVLGLTVPVLRFLRRYPSLFLEFPHPTYQSLPCFRLTDTALLLDRQERSIHLAHQSDAVERLSKLLMMSNSRSLPLQSLIPLRWDLGLPDDFITTLIPSCLDHFHVVRRHDGVPCLSLTQWRDEFAVSALQRASEKEDGGYRNFKKGRTLAFPMSFPRGYGSQKKVVAWMDEFQKLPYVSPYEDSSQIDPNSHLMEKRVVGVLHELLSLSIHKKMKRNYLRCLREELNLPHKFTRIFTRYPGIFYLSLKCKTTTVVLKEGYRRGKLVDPHPLARTREKFYYVMRTGFIYRGKGLTGLVGEKEDMGVDGFDQMGENSQEDIETDDEYYEENASNVETGSEFDICMTGSLSSGIKFITKIIWLVNIS
ncbi:protein WHAT'S THIS FACTOR 9, mitochondrial [Magnolia sinica]|uniref:protein WHAT'S THIS FACTOR 9, mitochondrial n=1 Tax=Magnolia sinica TaxID=86752 RepID=UPI0026593950|nr:protein WHAT'S THIS FACTOR 9, mitochondrial [Magnolia sinica]